jgi:hypothetical protein
LRRYRHVGHDKIRRRKLYLAARYHHVTVGYKLLSNLLVSLMPHTLLYSFYPSQFPQKYNRKSVGSNIDF